MAVLQPPIIYTPIPAGNRWVGKKSYIKGIVNHVAQCTTLAQLDNWFQNPNQDPSNPGQGVASANYGIGPDGATHCYVDPINTADAPFAHGIVRNPDDAFAAFLAAQNNLNPNYWLVGVEWVGWSNFPAAPFVPTPQQFYAGAWLTAWLAQQQGWVTDEQHMFAHCEIDSVTRSACNGWTRSSWTAYETAIASFQKPAPQPAPNDTRIPDALKALALADSAVKGLQTQIQAARGALSGVSMPAISALIERRPDFEVTGRRGDA